MSVVFQIKGRLGNALFRYFGCSIFCIKYKFKYTINSKYNIIVDDKDFIKWINIEKTSLPNINPNLNYLFNGYYQHDIIYRKYKNELLKYMQNNTTHYILTDGVNAGDRNFQKFFLNLI